MNQKMMLNTTLQHRILSVMFKNVAAVVAQKAAEPLAAYYSKVLEQPVNTRQTWLLVNAQMAFFLTVFPAACPMLLRIGFAAWLVDALLRCRREFPGE